MLRLTTSYKIYLDEINKIAFEIAGLHYRAISPPRLVPGAQRVMSGRIFPGHLVGAVHSGDAARLDRTLRGSTRKA